MEVNLTQIDQKAKNESAMICEKRSDFIRKEMIKFLKEGFWQDSIEYGLILEFINDFFVENVFYGVDED